ncbi:hypothetical protein [uncultured Tateyamaria sp.]|uniref:DUF883 family protein n=1 Tax=uncultured Tateyamaria sp. TaxID=455651 RepID=UPI00261EF263|nr:hypothetical protein [uncultured Tateyamaria sp.]
MSNARTTSILPTPNGSNASISVTAAEWADTARAQADTLRETVGAVAHDGREALQTAAHSVEKTAKSAQDSALATVRRNPGMAVAGAVGLGVLVGFALARRG